MSFHAGRRGWGSRLRLTVAMVLVAVACSGDDGQPDQPLTEPQVSYEYDAQGRLHSVTSASGEAALYEYDAAGNLLAIQRYSSPDEVPSSEHPAAEPAPVIDEVSPRVVAAGDTVTVRGKDFAVDPLLNAVALRDVYATVESVQAGALRAKVGPTATTGRLSVGTPGGRAESREEVFVAPPGYETDDIGPAGRTELRHKVRLEIDGDEVGLVVFDGRRGDGLALELPEDDNDFGPCGLHFGLTGPEGVVLRDANNAPTTEGCEGELPELHQLPADGTYTLVVAPIGDRAGSLTLSLEPRDPPDTPDESTPKPSPPPELPGVDPALFEHPAQTDVGVKAAPGGLFGGLPEFPVDLASGTVVFEQTDLLVGDVAPLALTRTYQAFVKDFNPQARLAFGVGSPLPFDVVLTTTAGLQYAELEMPGGVPITFVRTTPGIDAERAVFIHAATQTGLYGARIEWNGVGWSLHVPSGVTLEFGSKSQAPLRAIRDRFGQALHVRHVWDQYGNETRKVQSVQTPAGRWIEFAYDDQERVTEARDHLGRTARYTYDDGGRLADVAYSWGDSVGYGYDGAGRLSTVTGAGGTAIATMEYDDAGRVVRQTAADGSVFSIGYVADTEGVVTQTDVTYPNGVVRRVTFSGGHWMSDAVGLGTPVERSVSVERDPTSRFVTAMVSADGRRTSYGYDRDGHLTSVSTLDAAGSPVTTSVGYEDGSDRPSSMTDPTGRVIRYRYDDVGNVVEVEAYGAVTRYGYDWHGRLTKMEDPAGRTTTIAYELSHRVTVTDAAGDSWSEFYDAGGRLAVAVDANGNRSLFGYDELDRLVQLVQPDGSESRFGYEAAGNVASIADAVGNVTRYGYDAAGRVITRTDPSGAADQYEYDTTGNVVSHTDRRGVVSTFSYDEMGRPTGAAFGVIAAGPESTVALAYDAAGRLAQVTDSAYGVTTFGYDHLDRLVSESTPEGAISYEYDASGRRTTLNVSGIPVTEYGYDNGADLPTSITRGDLRVVTDRDSDGRVTNVRLPGDLTTTYRWGERGELAGIDYGRGDESTALGRLDYAHDRSRRRAAMAGDLAAGASALPDAVSGAGGAGNRMTTWGDAQFTYDAAGNVLSDGTNTYTWDARGQLVAIDGPEPATFSYDPFGRRVSKSVDGVTTRYRYDGPNIVQSTTDGQDPVAYLTGLAPDELYARIDGDGRVVSYLRDGQGSVIGLPDGTGEITTRYRYTPHGVTSVDGAADPNPFAYTGRELDETGLYYYRARYYSPDAGRFLSEDPIGFQAGDLNLYRYVSGDPVNYIDPSGECLASATAVLLATMTLTGEALVVIDAQIDGTITDEQAAIAMDNILHANQLNVGLFLVSCGVELLLTPHLVRAVGSGPGNWGRRPTGGGSPHLAKPTSRVGGPAAPNPVLSTPRVGNTKLQNIVNDLYKGTTNPGRVGTGTTADALRYELSTGQPVFGKSHLQKAYDSLRGLENWLKANPNAPYHDRLVARSLADDLLDALGGAP